MHPLLFIIGALSKRFDDRGLPLGVVICRSQLAEHLNEAAEIRVGSQRD